MVTTMVDSGIPAPSGKTLDELEEMVSNRSGQVDKKQIEQTKKDKQQIKQTKEVESGLKEREVGKNRQIQKVDSDFPLLSIKWQRW